MRTNPGGGLAPEEVVGRDALIADLWDKLERHSVMMTAERRMGKTSVLRKMLAQQPPGVTAFYWDLENIRSPEALVREIFNKVSEDLGNSQKWQGKLALLALDELAPESALTIGEWWNRVSIQTPDLDKEVFRSTLNLLEQDHYICRNDAGAYQFRFSLVQRYWHQQRGT